MADELKKDIDEIHSDNTNLQDLNTKLENDVSNCKSHVDLLNKQNS